VDFRLDANDGDKPYILEVDAFPDASSGWFTRGTNRTHADERFRPDDQRE
jgi:hypothetical protein